MITATTFILLVVLFPSTFMSIQSIIMNHALMMACHHLNMRRTYRGLVRIDQVMTLAVLRLFHFYYGMNDGWFKRVRSYLDHKGSGIYDLFRKSPLYTTPDDR